jgi:hypothetical protein
MHEGFLSISAGSLLRGLRPCIRRNRRRCLGYRAESRQYGYTLHAGRRWRFRTGTDGLTEARGRGESFGLDRVNAALAERPDPTPGQAVYLLRTRVAEFADGPLTDDLCLLAARID